MIKFGNKEITPKGYVKVMRGGFLVWQKDKDGTSTVTWILKNKISENSKSLIVPREQQGVLIGKQIISIKLDGIGEIKEGIKNELPFLGFWHSFAELFGLKDWVPVGTKITVAFK